MPSAMDTAVPSEDQPCRGDHSDQLIELSIVSPWQPCARRRNASDEFFLEGDIVCSLSEKLFLEYEEEEKIKSSEEFSCGVTNCNKSFTNVNTYEVHYNSVHRNKCTACKRSFPTSHLLEIHLSERHDPMFEIKSETQAMYQCLSQGCDCFFKTPNERRDHLMKTHKYPANFRFDRTPRKPRKQKGAPVQNTETMETEPSQPPSERVDHKPSGGDAESLDGQAHVSESGRKFVYKIPKSFSFGQGAQRSFQRNPPGGKKKNKKKHWHQQNKSEEDTTVDIEEVHMKDLEDALNS